MSEKSKHADEVLLALLVPLPFMIWVYPIKSIPAWRVGVGYACYAAVILVAAVIQARVPRRSMSALVGGVISVLVVGIVMIWIESDWVLGLPVLAVLLVGMLVWRTRARGEEGHAARGGWPK